MPASLGSPDSWYAYQSFSPTQSLSLCPSSSSNLWVSVPAQSKDELTFPNVSLKNIIFCIFSLDSSKQRLSLFNEWGEGVAFTAMD